MTITNRVSLKSVMGGNTPVADVVDAPTISTATAGVEAATVAYTAAATGGAATSFTAISTPGSITGTGSSPITVSGLTGGTSYTFKVYGTNSSGVWTATQSSASNSVTPAVATSFESIATATGTGSSGTITFSSIPSTYQHLQIRFFGFGTNESAFGRVLVRFNGDTDSNYSWHRVVGDGVTAVAADGALNQTSMRLIGSSYGLNTTTALVGIVDIHDYANTSKNKTAMSCSGHDRNNTIGGDILLASGSYRSTSAITSITLFADAGNYGTSTVAALYGIKGA